MCVCVFVGLKLVCVWLVMYCDVGWFAAVCEWCCVCSCVAFLFNVCALLVNVLSCVVWFVCLYYCLCLCVWLLFNVCAFCAVVSYRVEMCDLLIMCA